jgi:hypothetical protein
MCPAVFRDNGYTLHTPRKTQKLLPLGFFMPAHPSMVATLGRFALHSSHRQFNLTPRKPSTMSAVFDAADGCHSRQAGWSPVQSWNPILLQAKYIENSRRV